MKRKLAELLTVRMSMSKWNNPITTSHAIQARQEHKLKIPKPKRKHRYLGYLKGWLIYWFYVLVFCLTVLGLIKLAEIITEN